MKRKTQIITLLVLATTLLLSVSTQATTTLELWEFWTDAQVKTAITSMVAEFEKLNPEIKVNVTDLTWANGHEKIVIAFASKSGPDVLELGSDWVAQFADAGHLADISESVKPDMENFQGWGLT